MFKQNQAKVFSYIRFRTPEQAFGDSERRQLESARSFSKKSGLPFDESLRMTDRGLSGYHGTHRKKGALGQFLDRVEAGEIPEGSILVVENIDRLSRQGFLEAFEIIRQIIKNGISIHTVTPEANYDRDTLNSHAIYQLVGQMQLAYEESQKKSDRLSAAWKEKKQQAREDKKPITNQIPAWLKVEGDHFEVIPGAAEAIQKIFEMKLQGIGKGRIARFLNENGYWIAPKRRKAKTHHWRDSYLTKILSNPAVIGEYQPHHYVKDENTGKRKRVPEGEPVPNYFPAIIDPKTYHAMQDVIKANRGTGGRTGKATNLFSGIVKCPYCGSTMIFLDKGSKPKGGQYLVCDAKRYGKECRSVYIQYDEVEAAILSNCRDLRPEKVLPDPGEAAKQCEVLRRNLNGIKGELSEIEKRTANLLEQIETTENPKARKRYEDRMNELDDRTAKLTKQQTQLQKELVQAESESKNFKQWKRDLVELQKQLTSGDVDLRLRMRAHLKEFIDHIELFTTGNMEYDRTRNNRAQKDKAKLEGYMHAIEYETGISFPARFFTYASEKAQSRDARFIRVFFKTGAIMDMVPPKSLAFGRELLEDGKLGFVSPDIEKLWKRYKKRGVE